MKKGPDLAKKVQTQQKNTFVGWIKQSVVTKDGNILKLSKILLNRKSWIANKKGILFICKK